MASVVASVEIVRRPRPTLRLRWNGDYLNGRNHRALLLRVAAYVERESAGQLWTVHVDSDAEEIEIELTGRSPTEEREAAALLERAAGLVNAHGLRLARGGRR